MQNMKGFDKMTYIREDLKIGNTSLPTLGIEKDKLFTEYTII